MPVLPRAGALLESLKGMRSTGGDAGNRPRERSWRCVAVVGSLCVRGHCSVARVLVHRGADTGMSPFSTLHHSGSVRHLGPANAQPAQPRQLCGAYRPRRGGCSIRAQAKNKKTNPDPPDTPKEEARRGGREWLQNLLSKFGPLTEKAENTHVLDFEKPLVELDNRIKEVCDSVLLTAVHLRFREH